MLVALDTSFENPAPVRVIANAMTGYINKLGTVWVEGQIAQLTRRPSTSTVFLTLRDPLAEVSVQVTCPRSAFDAMTAVRPYRPARPDSEALEELARCAGSQFDPVVVQAFCAAYAEARTPVATP